MASLRFKPEPSPFLIRATAVLHLAALFAALANDLPWWLRGLIFALIVISLIHTLKRLRDSAQIPEVSWSDDKGWSLLYPGRERAIRVQLLGSSVMTVRICFLHFKAERGDLRHDVVVPRDALDAERFRELRVIMRTRGSG